MSAAFGLARLCMSNRDKGEVGWCRLPPVRDCLGHAELRQLLALQAQTRSECCCSTWSNRACGAT